ncbi:uncharacterized protein [Diabrotica undecimpunctata]|uniref:uncharacterized protein n=1 Tax=Diabrotica undecimpunctata TaxID=50387 RepID=UPI003B63B992
MAHKDSLEPLHRNMQDLNGNDKLFGDAVLLLSGDFRRALPVIHLFTYAVGINACNVRLTIKIRVQVKNDLSPKIFSKHLLNIGNGKINLHPNKQCIKLLDNFCTFVETKHELIVSVFPAILNNYFNHNWLIVSAILVAKNVDVNEINFQIQQFLPGDLIYFKSVDSIVNEDEAVDYPKEFFNFLDIPGIPSGTS